MQLKLKIFFKNNLLYFGSKLNFIFHTFKKVLCFTKTDLSVKTENGEVEITVKLNDDLEK